MCLNQATFFYASFTKMAEQVNEMFQDFKDEMVKVLDQLDNQIPSLDKMSLEHPCARALLDIERFYDDRLLLRMDRPIVFTFNYISNAVRRYNLTDQQFTEIITKLKEWGKVIELPQKNRKGNPQYQYIKRERATQGQPIPTQSLPHSLPSQ